MSSTQTLQNAWNDYLIATTAARNAIPNHPDAITQEMTDTAMNQLVIARDILNTISSELRKEEQSA